jgi:hypothetical protein
VAGDAIRSICHTLPSATYSPADFAESSEIPGRGEALYKVPELAEAAESLADAFGALIKRLENPQEHGFLRGTMEEAISLSQSAVMLGGDGKPIRHDESLISSHNGMEEDKKSAKSALKDLNSADSIAFSRVSRIIGEGLDYFFSLEEVQSQAIDLIKLIRPAHYVKTLYSNRLEGLALNRGYRDHASLVSTQISGPQCRAFFEDNKIQPTLYPFWEPKTAILDGNLKRTPINSLEIYRRLNPIKNSIDREINLATSRFGRGEPALSIIYSQFKKKL